MSDQPLLPAYDGACITNVVPALLHPEDVAPSWLPAVAAGAERVVLLAVWAGISSRIRNHLDSFTLADIAAMSRGQADWPEPELG